MLKDTLPVTNFI